MKNTKIEIKYNVIERVVMLYAYFIKTIFKLLGYAAMILVINQNIVHAAEETTTDDSNGSGSVIQDLQDTTSAVGGTLDTILDTLTSLTCETQGIGNLLRTEFTHTCVPAPFFTFAIANILSPGLYANTFLRLAINDEELFPGSCLRENRVEYDDQKISFAMCNNTKLAIARTAAISGVGITIAQTLFTGENVWDEILKAWNLPKDQYFEMFLDKKEGDEGMMIDIGVIPIFPWKVIREKDKLCVATQSLASWIPIGCKYIKEPYPISIYADFLDVGTAVHSELENVTSLTSCSNMGSCYKRAYDNSRAAIVVSGPIIECVKEMVAKMMISNSVCSFDDVKAVMGSELRKTSSFFLFQQNMHRIVSSLLAIYIILFGFKIILAGDVPPKSEIMNFVIKFIFVVYFSVGININTGSDDDTERLDGMIEWVIPFLMNGMEEISSWIVGANSNKFCNFQDAEYPANLSYLKLWDALDCRVMSFLGLDTLMRVAAQVQSNDDGNTADDAGAQIPPATNDSGGGEKDNMSYNIPPFIVLLVPAILSGVPILALLCLAYPIFIISFMALMVNATVVCIISIVILAVLAPVFVPLYLFDYTKGYFESWLKLLISFMLQPMVIVAFMTFMMALDDRAYNGTCKFDYIDMTLGGDSPTTNVNIMYINLSDGFINDGRTFRYFYPSFNWDDYDSEEEIEGCKNSLVYFVKKIIRMDFDSAFGIQSDESSEGQSEDVVVKKSGMFFDTVELVFEKIRMFAVSLFSMYLITYLMSKFSDTITDFAADITEGVSVASVTVKPATIQSALKKISSQVAGAAVKGVGGGLKGQAGNIAKMSGKGVGAVREGAIKGVNKAKDAVSSTKNKLTGQ